MWIQSFLCSCKLRTLTFSSEWLMNHIGMKLDLEFVRKESACQRVRITICVISDWWLKWLCTDMSWRYHTVDGWNSNTVSDMWSTLVKLRYRTLSLVTWCVIYLNSSLILITLLYFHYSKSTIIWYVWFALQCLRYSIS